MTARFLAAGNIVFASLAGVNGLPERAERALLDLQARGLTPTDFCFAMLIQAYSHAGEWRLALRVRRRLELAGRPLTVHLYNAMISACHRHQQWDRALELFHEMRRSGIEPNGVTVRLMSSVGKIGEAEGRAGDRAWRSGAKQWQSRLQVST